MTQPSSAIALLAEWQSNRQNAGLASRTAIALWHEGDHATAQTLLQTALILAPRNLIFALNWVCMSLKPVYADRTDIDAGRTEFRIRCADLLGRIEAGELDLDAQVIGMVTPYFLAYPDGNVAAEMRAWGRIIQAINRICRPALIEPDNCRGADPAITAIVVGTATDHASFVITVMGGCVRAFWGAGRFTFFKR
jgi:hypothetical protein